MFHEQRTTVPDSPERLRDDYRRELATIVDEHGLETAVDETDLERETLETLANGDFPDLSLEEAAEILALEERVRDPETVVTMACEHLLMGMSTAVLDVDALAGELELDLDPKEIQQKIERRAPMSFEEYVFLQHAIADNTP